MRKKVMAVVFAVLAFSLIAAFAASMPGPGDASVGVGTQIIGACQDDGAWDVDYDVSWAGGEFRITQANVSGLDAACNGQDISVRVLDIGGGVLGPPVSGVVDGSGNATLPGLNASAELAEGAVIAISG